jgi:hypothetical protein
MIFPLRKWFGESAGRHGAIFPRPPELIAEQATLSGYTIRDLPGKAARASRWRVRAGEGVATAASL